MGVFFLIDDIFSKLRYENGGKLVFLLLSSAFNEKLEYPFFSSSVIRG